jgi:hypothetical protein
MSIEADSEDALRAVGGRVATIAQVPGRLVLGRQSSALRTIATWRKSVSFWQQSQKIRAPWQSCSRLAMTICDAPLVGAPIDRGRTRSSGARTPQGSWIGKPRSAPCLLAGGHRSANDSRGVLSIHSAGFRQRLRKCIDSGQNLGPLEHCSGSFDSFVEQGV